ncbi:ABC transporter substrate-binding protein [Devosia sp. 2618]|uniref:ABC transporter substrate-binding protein n=1 Tax=Devosia sp. 2618 TaxID=3156454 RepID=UPI00339B419C
MIRTLLVVSAAALALMPAMVIAEPWSYTDSLGNTVTLDNVPTRIIASQDAAAGLIPLGIRPVGIYADSPVEDAKALEGLDLTGIQIIGQTWGEVDIEKAAALNPELIIAEYWPLDTTWSGGTSVVDALTPLAPITGPTNGDSILKLVEDYEVIAASLGADLSNPTIAENKAGFETSLAAFKAATAAKPNLTVLALWAGTDSLSIAATEASAELLDFRSWGLNIIDPAIAEDRGYWETLSWENADKYQPDLIIVDNRSPSTMQIAVAQPTWTLMKAAAAGAVTDWPAYWIRNYAAYSGALDKLTTAINAADENLTE